MRRGSLQKGNSSAKSTTSNSHNPRRQTMQAIPFKKYYSIVDENANPFEAKSAIERSPIGGGGNLHSPRSSKDGISDASTFTTANTINTNNTNTSYSSSPAFKSITLTNETEDTNKRTSIRASFSTALMSIDMNHMNRSPVPSNFDNVSNSRKSIIVNPDSMPVPYSTNPMRFEDTLMSGNAMVDASYLIKVNCNRDGNTSSSEIVDENISTSSSRGRIAIEKKKNSRVSMVKTHLHHTMTTNMSNEVSPNEAALDFPSARGVFNDKFDYNCHIDDRGSSSTQEEKMNLEEQSGQIRSLNSESANLQFADPRKFRASDFFVPISNSNLQMQVSASESVETASKKAPAESVSEMEANSLAYADPANFRASDFFAPISNSNMQMQVSASESVETASKKAPAESVSEMEANSLAYADPANFRASDFFSSIDSMANQEDHYSSLAAGQGGENSRKSVLIDDSLPLFDDSVFRFSKKNNNKDENNNNNNKHYKANGKLSFNATVPVRMSAAFGVRRLSIKDVIEGLREDRSATEKAIVYSIAGRLLPSEFRDFIRNMKTPPTKSNNFVSSYDADDNNLFALFSSILDDNNNSNSSSSSNDRRRSTLSDILSMIESPTRFGHSINVSSATHDGSSQNHSSSRPSNPMFGQSSDNFITSSQTNIPRFKTMESVTSQLDMASTSIRNIDFHRMSGAGKNNLANIRQSLSSKWAPPQIAKSNISANSSKINYQQKQDRKSVNNRMSINMGSGFFGSSKLISIASTSTLNVNANEFNLQDDPFRPFKALVAHTPSKGLNNDAAAIDGDINANRMEVNDSATAIATSTAVAEVDVEVVSGANELHLSAKDDDDEEDEELSRILDEADDESTPAEGTVITGTGNVDEVEVDIVNYETVNELTKQEIDQADDVLANIQSTAANSFDHAKNVQNENISALFIIELQKLRDELIAQKEAFFKVINDKFELQTRLAAVESKAAEKKEEEKVQNTEKVPDWYYKAQIDNVKENIKELSRFEADIEMRRARRKDREVAEDKETHRIWNHLCETKAAAAAAATAKNPTSDVVMEEIDIERTCTSPDELIFSTNFVQYAEIGNIVRPQPMRPSVDNLIKTVCMESELITTAFAMAGQKKWKEARTINLHSNTTFGNRSAFESGSSLENSRRKSIETAARSKSSQQVWKASEFNSNNYTGSHNHNNYADNDGDYGHNNDYGGGDDGGQVFDTNDDDGSSTFLQGEIGKQMVGSFNAVSKSTVRLDGSFSSAGSGSRSGSVRISDGRPPMAKSTNMNFKPLVSKPLLYEPSEYSLFVTSKSTKVSKIKTSSQMSVKEKKEAMVKETNEDRGPPPMAAGGRNLNFKPLVSSVVNSNYSDDDDDSPVARSRGRPPKKVVKASVIALKKKKKTTTMTKTRAKSASPEKKRGRKRKIVEAELEEDTDPSVAELSDRLSDNAVDDNGNDMESSSSSSSSSAAAVPKQRGRPKNIVKNVVSAVRGATIEEKGEEEVEFKVNAKASDSDKSTASKSRGRPPKVDKKVELASRSTHTYFGDEDSAVESMIESSMNSDNGMPALADKDDVNEADIANSRTSISGRMVMIPINSTTVTSDTITQLKKKRKTQARSEEKDKVDKSVPVVPKKKGTKTKNSSSSSTLVVNNQSSKASKINVTKVMKEKQKLAKLNSAAVSVIPAKTTFQLFCLKVKPDVQAQNPDFTSIETTKELSRMWKQLSIEDKSAWHEATSESSVAMEVFGAPESNHDGDDDDDKDEDEKVVEASDDRENVDDDVIIFNFKNQNKGSLEMASKKGKEIVGKKTSRLDKKLMSQSQSQSESMNVVVESRRSLSPVAKAVDDDAYELQMQEGFPEDEDEEFSSAPSTRYSTSRMVLVPINFPTEDKDEVISHERKEKKEKKKEKKALKSNPKAAPFEKINDKKMKKKEIKQRKNIETSDNFEAMNEDSSSNGFFEAASVSEKPDSFIDRKGGNNKENSNSYDSNSNSNINDNFLASLPVYEPMPSLPKNMMKFAVKNTSSLLNSSMNINHNNSTILGASSIGPASNKFLIPKLKLKKDI